jgi:hypothetical protein
MTAAILLFLIALAFLAPRFGADSRDGRDWQFRQRGRPW